MRIALLVALAACTDAAATDGPIVNDPPLVPDAALPQTSGEYVSRYIVPVTADLVAAADFPVDHVEWTIANGMVTLHYDLPPALVGGDVDVTLTGTLVAGATTLDIAGPVGTGTCVATTTTLTCREVFTGLPALPISMTVVEDLARTQYPGPTGDRTRVATVFGSDPIGIVELDLTRPAIDDDDD